MDDLSQDFRFLTSFKSEMLPSSPEFDLKIRG